MIEELAEAKVKFAVVFASGFAETGDAGRGRPGPAGRRGASAPGCGCSARTPTSTPSRRSATTSTGPAIALITQSGHQGRPVFTLQELGIRLSHWAPTGNEADLETADFISYFAEQPEVGAIACYVEGLKDGRSFLLAADRAARRGVPVVAVKVGRTETGARTAASHTGKLTGADAVVDAAMRPVRRDPRRRARRTPGHRRPAGAGPRRRAPTGVVVYSISGGTGAHFADLATAAGLRLPTLSEAKQAELHQWIPGVPERRQPRRQRRASGRATGAAGRSSTRSSPTRRSGVLICPITGPFPPMSDQLAQDLVDAAETHGQAGVRGVGIAGRHRGRPTARSCSAPPGVATFRTFGNCITAVRAYLDHHRFTAALPLPLRRGPAHPLPVLPQGAGPDAPAASS